MAVIRFITNIILSLYKGLIYWFFWASFVTMRDEMFCSYATSSTTENCHYTITTDNTGLLPVKTTTNMCKLLCKICNDLKQNTLRARQAAAAEIARNMANLRLLTEAAKNLPQRHRLRIALYSG